MTTGTRRFQVARMMSIAMSTMQKMSLELEVVKAIMLNIWTKAVSTFAKLSKTIKRLIPVFSFLPMTITEAVLTTKVRAKMNRLAHK